MAAPLYMPVYTAPAARSTPMKAHELIAVVQYLARHLNTTDCRARRVFERVYGSHAGVVAALAKLKLAVMLQPLAVGGDGATIPQQLTYEMPCSDIQRTPPRFSLSSTLM